MVALALDQLGQQTGAIMLYPFDLAESRQANSVVGHYTLPDALDILLKNTGLSGGLSDKRVVSISLAADVERIEEEEEMAPQKAGLATKTVAGLGMIFASMGATGQEPETIEEIVIVGSRLQNQRSIDAKRSTFQNQR